jgi:hypothetical protein
LKLQVFRFGKVEVLGKAAQRFSWETRAGLTSGQALANEVNKGVKRL